MKCTKRIISMMLVLMLTIALFVPTAIAAEDNLSEKLADQIITLYNDYQEDFERALDLFNGFDNIEGFLSVFEDLYEEQVDRISGIDVTIVTFSSLAAYVESYQGQYESGDFAAVVADKARLVELIEDEATNLIVKLVDAGITSANIDQAFEKVEQVLEVLKLRSDLEALLGVELNFPIFRSTNNVLTLDSQLVDELIDFAGNALGTSKIVSNKEVIVEGLNLFIGYYNSNATNKNALHNFLNSYGFIVVVTPPPTDSDDVVTPPQQPSQPTQPTQPVDKDDDEFELIEIEFSDIDEEIAAWAGEAIKKLSQYGILKGRGNGIFDPSANASRAEFATMISRLLALESDETSMFDDVDSKAWYASTVNAVAKAGYINGRGNNKFVPNESITREEIATILGRILLDRLDEVPNAEELLKGLTYFVDADEVSDWAQLGVAVLYQYEIVNGRSGQTFAPKANATRAEVATMIYRITSIIETIVK
ncbi:S-layer family protein [Natranaerovirga pectinivora]|uniref:S-layer family protein n=1 Tax=Natranaerovirga pectinivora TaxID=682400 RepID=A0A4R3MGE9_9FIRM|nr:S-layer homology domain-containing protein [Natranaerovirga pectinivora]TCT12834.1 S-layer family protein [Natranaerovirga pectinivora]